MGGTPPYARIVADIERRIADGDLAAGERVPSTRQLVADYGVAMATATKALTALRQAGLVRAVPGVGTVVTDRRDRAADRPAGGPATHAGGDGTDRARVIRTAMALADREGAAGVSMRRVAADLGIATMSLYRYVANRDDLVTRMVDAAIADYPLPDPPPVGWRPRVEVAARQMWRACRDHPWLAPSLSVTRPQLIPHGMDHTEWYLASFAGYDLDTDTRLHLAVGVVLFVRGVAVAIEPEVRAEQDTGLTDEEWMTEQKPAFLSVAEPARYPMLSGIMRTEVDLTLDSLFEFGLARHLDGIAAFLATLR